MLNGNRAQTEWHPATEEDRSAVREQLERVLASPLFRNSKRYPALLRFVVEQSLVGREHLLKERQLGIEVFHRQPDYDTNQDTVVRLTAGEVRRRIAQYYQQPEHGHELRIHLNAGSYAPHFFPGLEQKNAVSLAHALAANGLAEAGAESAAYSTGVQAPPEPPTVATHGSRRWRTSVRVGLAALVMTSLLVVSLLLTRAIGSRQSVLDLLWKPVLAGPDPVLLIIPDMSQADAGVPAQRDEQTNELNHLRQGRLVNFSDSVALAQITAYLAREKKPFDVQLSSEASYTRLQQGPAILIGGLDNPWTMRALQPMRFYMERRGSSLTFDIVDRVHPERRPWSLDGSKPFGSVTTDYAVVASELDRTTGRPMLIVAGLGANGTIAGEQFLLRVGSDLLPAPVLSEVEKGRNAEFVIQTQVIDDKAGPPRLIAQTFW